MLVAVQTSKKNQTTRLNGDAGSEKDVSRGFWEQGLFGPFWSVLVCDGIPFLAFFGHKSMRLARWIEMSHVLRSQSMMGYASGCPNIKNESNGEA